MTKSLGARAAALACVSAGLLIYEVTLLRLFGRLLAYHYAGLAASIALLGVGVGGGLAGWKRLEKIGTPSAAGIAAVLAALTPGLVWAVSALTFVPAYGLAALPPFLVGGFFTVRLLGGEPGRRTLLLAADLAGSAVGCGLAVAILDAGGPPLAFSVASGLAVFAGILLSAGTLRWGLVAALPMAAGSAWGIASWAGGFLPVPNDLRVTKNLYTKLREVQNGELVQSFWTSYARTDVVQLDDPKFRHVFTDGEATTLIPRLTRPVDPTSPDLETLECRMRIGFLPFQVFSPKTVFVVGVGGGLDAAYALFGGATKVVGVEVNPQTVRAVREEADFSADLYSDPRLEVHADEARSFLERDPRRYDMLYLSLTLTNVSTVPGYALVENYVHTREACRRYLDRVNERGWIAHLMHGWLDLDRALAAWIDALGGGLNALDHIAIVGHAAEKIEDPARWFKPLLLVSRAPMSDSERQDLAARVRAAGYRVLYLRGVEVGPYGLLDSFGVAAYGTRITHNFEAATDERPFPNQYSKAAPPEVSRAFLWTALAAAVTLVLAWWNRRASPGAGSLLTVAWVVGAAFLLVESALVVRLLLPLGRPALAFSVIVFTVLLAASLGALVAGGFRISLRAACLIAAGGVAVQLLIWPWAVGRMLHLSSDARNLNAILCLAPTGFCMGMPFSVCLRLANASEISWMWAVNGIASVAGAGVAMYGAMTAGLSATVAIGAALYLAAALLSPRMKEVTE